MKTQKIFLACMFLFVGFFAKAQIGCQAYFYSSQSGQVVQFHDTSYSSTTLGGSITAKYFWTFGDGQKDSVNKNPIHTYANYGTYTVCLKFKVYQSGVGFCTDSFCKTITIGCANPPTVSISGATIVTPGQSAILTAIPSGGTGPYQYNWSNGKYTERDTVIPTGANSYCVTVYDNLQCSATACHNVTVNTALTPGAVNDSICASLNAPTTILVLANDTNLNAPSVSIVGSPANCTVTISGTSFIATPLQAGQAYFYYKVCNANNKCDTARVKIMIGGCTPTTNHPPVTTSYTAKVCKDSLLYMNAATFCSDPDSGSVLTYTVITQPTHGSTLVYNSYIKYTPNGTYTGQDIIRYKVCDNGSPSLCDTDYIYVFVDSCNTSTIKPIAFDDTVCTKPNTAILVYVLANDHDLDASPSITLLGTSTGTVTANPANNTFEFSPGGGYIGAAIFYYKVCNSNGKCDTGRVVVNVDNSCGNINHAPITNSYSTQHCKDSLLYVNAANFTTDQDSGSVLTYSVLTQPLHGTSQVFNSYIKYTPNGTYTGQDFIKYQVCDNGNPSLCDTGYLYLYLYTCNSTSACHDTICGVVFNDTNGNGVKDPTENGIANSYVYAGNYTGKTDSTGYYQIIVPCGLNTIRNYPPQTCCIVGTVPLPNPLDSAHFGHYEFRDSSHSRICGFNFGYQNTGVTISGYLYLDANNNGVKDPGENVIPNQAVLIAGHYVYTNANGYYVLNVPAGNYTLTCVPYAPYAGATVTPTSVIVLATNPGTVYPNNNFGLYVTQGVDLSVTIAAISNVSPGFPAYYYVDVCNVGTVATGGVASFYFDSHLQFAYASPTQTTYNSTAHTLSFNVPTLAPGACDGYYVKFELPSTVALGTPIFNMVTVTPLINPDVNLTNNTDTIHQLVEGSWDPNNKIANGTYTYPTNSTKYILPNTAIEYTVNFQNTGTAPAINVIVKDELDASVDVNSFKLLGTSHDCQVIRDGSNVNFKFSNIMLPDSSKDEKRSHGFVRFSVKPNSAAVGTTIYNTAQIFFDYNDAVVTNTTENIIAVSTGINEEYSVSEIVVAPNPFSSYTTISVKGVATESIEMTTFDVTGRLVSAKIYSNPENMRFERNGLNQGVYIYQLKQQGKLIGKGKLVIE